MDGNVNETQNGLDDGLDFLDFGSDILDSFRGLLAFDLDMANAKDIDDGGTVAGAMDDFIETQAQLQDALLQVAIQDEALAHAEDENAKLRERLAKMEAQAAEDQRRWELRQQAGQQVSTGDAAPLSDQVVTRVADAATDTSGSGVASTPSRVDGLPAVLPSPPPVLRDQSGLLQVTTAAGSDGLNQSVARGFEPLDPGEDGGDPLGSPPQQRVTASRPDASSQLVSPDNETGSRGATGSTVDP